MRGIRNTLTIGFSLAVIGLSATGVAQRQAIWDWWRLREFTPSARIVELADKTTMTDYGRRLFFVHHPAMNDAAEFVRNCPQKEGAIVLGCYIANHAIFIYDVQDERLYGLEEVTAAHEMLHAAYDRLRPSERQRIDGLLSEVFAALPADGRIRTTVALYAEHDVPSELHSRLGTELRELPAELEEHYRRYFVNRLRVVEFAEKYEAVFAAQQARLQQLAQQIAALEAELKVRRDEIERRGASLERQLDELNAMRAAGQIEQYNAAVPGYNQQVEAYRAQVNRFNADVARLNRLIEEHNALALAKRELYDAMDSRL